MNIFKKRKSGKKGFTLMEMLIVVAIIGILIAIMIPTFSNALTKARISADEANLRSYYSEVLTNYMLKDDSTGNANKKLSEFTGTTMTSGKSDSLSVVKVGGAEYTLQAGTYVVTVDDDKETMSIEYTPTSHSFKKVTIPGGKTADNPAA